MRTMITGVILARNEEANVVASLTALRPHVDELLLIDMESGDRTIELAMPLVDRVLHHPVVANFDPARSIAMAEAEHDWLWFVDSDEIVPEETGKLVRQVVREQGHEFVALSIPFRTWFCGVPIEHCGWVAGHSTRSRPI